MKVAIISAEGDQSTYHVMDWILDYYQKDAYLIDGNCKLSIALSNLSNQDCLSIEYNNEKINLNQIRSFWHRRGGFSISLPSIEFPEDLTFEKKINDHLNNEQRKLKEYVYFKYGQKKRLGNAFRADINKLVVLNMAQTIGINIPATLITTNKDELLKFKNKHGRIVCKPISEGLASHNLDIGIITYYTSLVSDDMISSLKDTFPVSLFQQAIDKKYELRIFFIDGELYTMAIFSQQDAQTRIDFRRYNHEKPNRTVPYKLPYAVKHSLNELMKQLNLNTGSIDMAVTQNNEYVFFEVNPVGQFAMTSHPCNYYLEKKIATYLCT